MKKILKTMAVFVFLFAFSAKISAAESYKVGDKVLFGDFGGHVIEDSDASSNTVKVYIDGWNKTKEEWDAYWDNYVTTNNLSSRAAAFEKVGIPVMHGQKISNENYSALSNLASYITYTTSSASDSDVTTGHTEYNYKFLKVNVSNVKYDWLLKDNINLFGDKTVITNSFDNVDWYTIVDDVSYANCDGTIYDDYYSSEKKEMGKYDCKGISPADVKFFSSSQTYSFYSKSPIYAGDFGSQSSRHYNFVVPTFTLNKDKLTLALEKCSDYSDSYKITYETNGGNKIDALSATGNKELTIPTREGYIFDGWYTDSKLTTKVSSVIPTQKEKNNCIAGYNDVTVYAKWKRTLENKSAKIVGNEEYLNNVHSFATSPIDKITTVDLSQFTKYMAYSIQLRNTESKEVEPTGVVKLSLRIPEGFDKTKLAVARIENGKLIEYASTVNGDYIEVDTDHFSIYVVGEKVATSDESTPKEIEEENQGEKIEGEPTKPAAGSTTTGPTVEAPQEKTLENPETSDNIVMYLLLGGLLLIGTSLTIRKIKYTK